MDVGGGSSVTDEKQRPVGGGEAGAIDQLDYDEDLLRTAIAELRAGKLHFAHSSAGGNGLDAGDDSATQVAIANGYRGVAPNQPFASAAAGDGAVGYDPNGQYLGAADPNNEFSATGGFSDPSFIFTPYGGYEMQNLQSVSGDRTVPVGPVTDYNGYGYGAQVNRAFYADSMELTADQSAVPPPFNPQSQVAAPSAVQQLQLQLQYESDVKLYEYLSNRLYMQHVNEVGVHYPVDSVRSFAAESATSGSVFRVRSPEPNPEGAMATGRRVNGNALPPDVLSNIVSVDESETTIELDVMPLATSQVSDFNFSVNFVISFLNHVSCSQTECCRFRTREPANCKTCGAHLLYCQSIASPGCGFTPWTTDHAATQSTSTTRGAGNKCSGAESIFKHEGIEQYAFHNQLRAHCDCGPSGYWCSNSSCKCDSCNELYSNSNYHYKCPKIE